MNIQIWGTAKSFDTKKAERYLKSEKSSFKASISQNMECRARNLTVF